MSTPPGEGSQKFNIGRSLAAAFFLRPGETWPVLMLLAFSFSIGMASAFLYSASAALFLEGEGNILFLPYIYIIASVIIIVSGFFIDKIQGKVDIQKFLPAVLIFITVFTLFFGAFSWFNAAGRIWSFGVIIWYYVIVTLINIVQLALPSLIFDLRQSKRLYGLITSGELLASALGFLLVPFLVGAFGTAALVTFSSATFLASVVVVVVILRKYRQHILDLQHEQSKEAEVVESIFSRDILRDRYIVQLSLLVFFSLSSYYFIDFAFNRFAAEMGDASKIAVFLGYFFAAAEGLVFVIKTFFSGRIVNRFGVRVSLSILPVLLLVGTILGGAFSPAMGLAMALATFIQLNKLFDTVFRSAVHEPGFAILYQPLRPRQRMTAQTLTQGVVDPLSMGVAGVALIFLAKAGTGGTVMLVGIILLMTAGWIIVTFTINRDYTVALMRAMKGRILDGGGVSLDDLTSRNVLLDKLKSPLAGEVIYALDILEKNGDAGLSDAVVSVAQHPEQTVRVDVFERAARMKLAAMSDMIDAAIANSAEPRVRAAAVKAYCALHEEESVDKIGPLMDDPELEVRVGAMTGLLRNGGIDGILAAADRLIRFGGSSDAGERRLAARIIGEVGVMSFYRPLRDLINDPDPGVQEAALHAAGLIRNMRLLPVLVDALTRPHVNAAAASAMALMGTKVLPALAEMFDDTTMEVKGLIRATRVVGRIRGESAVALLKSKMQGTPEPVRNQVMVSLHLCQFRAIDHDAQLVTDIIRNEVDFAARFLALQELLDGPDTVLLNRALELEINRIRSRIFYLLSFIYDPRSIFRARDNLVVASREHRAFAMEMLDTELASDLKRLFLPLVEELAPHERITRLGSVIPQTALSKAQHLHALISAPDANVNAWTKACAVQLASMQGLHDLVDDIALLFRHTERYVREAALSAVHHLDSERFILIASDALHTESSLAPLVRAIQSHQTTPMLLTIEKVIILKTVAMFAETPDDVLVEVASILAEEVVAPGQTIIKKGDVGNCMYIIHEGKVRVHDGDVTYAELTDRQPFGDWALLDNDVRSASITAITETVLLRLDQDAFYEIMSDRIEVARGIIRELTKRLRRQNETLMKLQKATK